MNQNVTQFIAPLFQPLGLLWAVLLILALVCFTKRSRGAGLIMLAIWLAFSAVGSTSLPYFLIGTLERPYVGKTVWAARPGDAVLVLGGGPHFSTNDSFHLGFGGSSSRIVAAVELIRRHKAGTLVIGGGGYTEGSRKRPESELVRDWLQSWKVCDEAQVIPLEICENTHDEVLRAEKLAQEHHWRRVILVSSAFHLKRAEGLCRQIGLPVETVACDFRAEGVARPFRSIFPGAQTFEIFEDYLHEILGWYVYRWRGWVKG